MQWQGVALEVYADGLRRSRKLTRGYSGKVDHPIAAQREPVKGKLASLVTFGDP